MSGLYFCAQCGMIPLRWFNGNGYCSAHAVAFGVPDTDEAYGVKQRNQRRVNTSTYTPSAKMNASEKLKAYMASIQSDLQSLGEWEEPAQYQPDLFSESRVEHDEIPALNLPYQGLDGKPKALPF